MNNTLHATRWSRATATKPQTGRGQRIPYHKPAAGWRVAGSRANREPSLVSPIRYSKGGEVNAKRDIVIEVIVCWSPTRDGKRSMEIEYVCMAPEGGCVEKTEDSVF
ncbi:MAG: hypothetical protein LQ352_001834 [Teloschistes flavicans]|nr:MAG: hypothetical protein LQ352_001834 [Teloschistes flavicans]